MSSAEAAPRLTSSPGFWGATTKRRNEVARHREAVCRLCRREGQKLFLKGLRCFTEKCAIEKRNFVPGQHGQSRRPKVAGYGLQLREKQKVKRTYGLLERQFRSYFHKAEIAKGPTGENLIVMLERRLDNVVKRVGLSGSHAQARQLVLHGHVSVNGRKVNIPSFLVSVGDEIVLKPKMHQNTMVLEARNVAQSQNTVPWLEIDRDNFKARVVALPKRENVQTPVFNEQLIVELYSK
jgi:small subunit ribosomal protein S4